MSVAALEKRKEDKSGNGSNTLEMKKTIKWDWDDYKNRKQKEAKLKQ